MSGRERGDDWACQLVVDTVWRPMSGRSEDCGEVDGQALPRISIHPA